jgi:hypothetical protein
LELLQLPSSTKSLPEWQEDFLNGIVLENIDEQERAMNVDTFVAQIYLEFLASPAHYTGKPKKNISRWNVVHSAEKTWKNIQINSLLHKYGITATTAGSVFMSLLRQLLTTANLSLFLISKPKSSLPFYQSKPKLQSHQIRFKKLIDFLSFSQANYFNCSLDLNPNPPKAPILFISSFSFLMWFCHFSFQFILFFFAVAWHTLNHESLMVMERIGYLQ